MTKDIVESFESSLRELESTARAVVSLENFIGHYSIESMEGAELDLAIHHIDGILDSNEIIVEDLSLEADGDSGETSAAAASTSDKAEGQTKGEKVKKFAQDTLEKMKAKLKTLPEEIKKYAAIIMDTLTNSAKGLSNSAKQILSKLDDVEETQSKISGNYSIFTDVRPQAAIASVMKGIVSLGDQSKGAADVIAKTSDGAKSTLTLYDYKGTSYEFDGTDKFFDMKLETKKIEINGLSKGDVKLVCENIIKLSDAIETAKDKLPGVADVSNVAISKAESSSNKEGFKAAFALSTFYRKVVGGYIKYTIKVSKLALNAANGSIKTS